MKTVARKDFEAFTAKSRANPLYEKRGSGEPTIEHIAEAITSIADSFDAFKAGVSERETRLRAHVERLETRLSRPGAIAAPGGEGEGESVRYLETRDGRKLPLLTSRQRLADLVSKEGDDGFSIGQYVRDAVAGSTKAASGPALVPTGLASTVIDRVRQATVLVEAGASTIVIDQPTNVARLTGDPTAHQHTEGATDISESDILAVPVALNPKTLVALVPLTLELVSDSPNLDAVLSTSLIATFAAKLDVLGLAILLADADIPKSLAAQDPAVWLKTLEAVGAALVANQRLPGAHISAPADFIARASQLASTAGTWLGKPPALSVMRELQTTGLTAGTALFGDFAAGFAVALRSELRVEVVRFAKPTSASHLLVAHMRADGVVIQPARLFKQLKVIV